MHKWCGSATEDRLPGGCDPPADCYRAAQPVGGTAVTDATAAIRRCLVAWASWTGGRRKRWCVVGGAASPARVVVGPGQERREKR